LGAYDVSNFSEADIKEYNELILQIIVE